MNDESEEKIDKYLKSKGIDIAEIVKQMVHEGFLEVKELV